MRSGIKIKTKNSITLLLFLLITQQILSQSDYTIAAFYYPWYSGSNNIHWNEGFLREKLIPVQLPELGLYNSFDESIVDRHISWSEDYGINAWIISWWGQTSRENTWFNTFIKNRLIDRNVEFCIVYESGILPNWNWDEEQTRTRFKNDMIFIAENYFDHPNYFKIDNKPVVYVYVTRGFFGNHSLGIQEARQALADKGYEIYFIADGIDIENSLGNYDALSIYLSLEVGDCLSRDGSYPYQNNCIQQIRDFSAYLKIQAHRAGIKFIPNIAPGFNKDGWGSNPNQFWACPPQIHPDSDHVSLLSELCDIAKEYADSSLRLVTVTSFNEWHEDTQIEPTVISDETNTDTNNGVYTNGYSYKGYGTDRLETIARKFDKKITSLERNSVGIPDNYLLKQNYPNPFNPSTTIRFDLPKTSFVEIKIYNSLGRELTQLISREMVAGNHRVTWDAKGYSSGIYFYRIIAGEFTDTKKLILVK